MIFYVQIFIFLYTVHIYCKHLYVWQINHIRGGGQLDDFSKSHIWTPGFDSPIFSEIKTGFRLKKFGKLILPPNFTKPGMFSFFQPTSPISQPYIQTPLTITLLLIDLEQWFCMLKPHFRGRGIQWKHFRTCKTNRVARYLSRGARIWPFLRVWWQYEFYLT